MVVDVGLVVNLEDYAEGQFLLVGTQRADVVAEFLGQHGDGAVDEVDRGATVQGLAVDGRAFLHVVRHVSDMHAHFPVSIGQLLEAYGIVEVFGIGRVDGDGEHLAEVAALLDFVIADRNRYSIGFFFNFFWKLYRIFVGGQDAFHLHVVLARFAEHSDNLTEGVARSVGPVHEMDDDFLAVFGTVEVATRDEDIHGHPFYIGANEDIAVADAQQADELSMAALQHLHNLAFGLRVVALWEHRHANTVAMQSLVSVTGCDEDVLAFAVVAHHISLARRFHLHRAFHIFLFRPELGYALGTHHVAIRMLLA